MSSDDLKALARREMEAFRTGDLSIIDEIIAPGYVGHDLANPEEIRGPEGVKAQIQGYRTAFPDLELTIESQHAEGDTVVTRWSGRGTHRGDLWGIAPTGRECVVAGCSVVRCADGQFHEDWTYWDALGLMQQIGAVSTAGAGAAAGHA